MKNKNCTLYGFFSVMPNDNVSTIGTMDYQLAKRRLFFGEIKLTPAIEKDAFNIAGILRDEYGETSVRGKIIGTTLSFTKVYVSGISERQLVKYFFKKNEGDILGCFNGHWENDDASMNGPAVCSLIIH